MRSEFLTPEEIEATLKPLDQALCLPGRIYHDEDIYAEEMASIFSREWVAIAPAAKIPNPGDYFTLELAGKPLLFVRGSDGIVRCFSNVCRHRGMQVALGEGNKESFQCGYHRWTYNHSGDLVHAPEMPGMLNCNIRLPEVRASVWQGLIFVNFRDDAPDLHQQLSKLGKLLEPWRADELELLYERPYSCDWNWKIMFENGIETYHILGTHRVSLEDSTPTHLSFGDPGDHRNYAEVHLLFDPNAGELFPVDATVPQLPELPAWATEKFVYFAVYPNLILSQTPDGLQAYITIPHGPQKSTFTWSYITHRSARTSPNYEKFKKTQEDFADLVQSEDEVCCRPVQASMNSGEYIPGPYNQRELSIWAFHRWYTHRIADGTEASASW